MKKPLSVLVINDSENDTLKIIKELEHVGYEPIYERVSIINDLSRILPTQPWNIIFSDFELKHLHALDALLLIKSRGFDIPFIVLSKPIGEEKLVELMKAGANNFLIKWRLGQLEKVLDHELREAKARHEKDWAISRIIHAKQEWESAFDAISSLLIITDIDGIIIRINGAAKYFFETADFDILGTHIENLLFENVEVGLENQDIRGDIRFYLSDKWFNISSYPILIGERHHGNLFALHDVTARKEIEAARLKLHELTGLGTIVAEIISQELEKPLQAMIDLGESCSNGEAGREELIEGYRSITCHFKVLMNIQNRLQRFSETSQKLIRPHELSALIKDALLLYGDQIKAKKSFILRTDLKSNLPLLNCDQYMIIQAITSLIINSHHLTMPDGGIITIRTGYDNDKKELFLGIIIDTGKGLSDLDWERMFGPFNKEYGEKDLKNLGLGLGLDLAVVDRIVKAHFGEIEIITNPRFGRTIRITFSEKSLKK